MQSACAWEHVIRQLLPHIADAQDLIVDHAVLDTLGFVHFGLFLVVLDLHAEIPAGILFYLFCKVFDVMPFADLLEGVHEAVYSQIIPATIFANIKYHGEFCIVHVGVRKQVFK
jgi:hypothetical protein